MVSRNWSGIDLVNVDTASPDDPNEISFAKGEILDIVDKTGKWWQAKRTDGTTGSECILSNLIITLALTLFHSCALKCV